MAGGRGVCVGVGAWLIWLARVGVREPMLRGTVVDGARARRVFGLEPKRSASADENEQGGRPRWALELAWNARASARDGTKNERLRLNEGRSETKGTRRTTGGRGQTQGRNDRRAPRHEAPRGA